MSMSGVYDELYKNFLHDFMIDKIEMKKAIKDGFFNELKQLNEKRWGGKRPDNDFMNTLIIATNFDKPRLYSCWPLGKMEEKPCLTLGSGSEYASDYIFKQNKLIPQGISLEDGIRIAVSSLESASQDIYTGGLDLVIITEDGIKEYGEEIKNVIKSAKDGIINKVIKELK